MASQPEQANDRGDKVKIVCAFLAVVAGIVGFYLLAGKSTLTRMGVLAAGIIVGGVLAWFSSAGRNFLTFAQDSSREVKKVVWPERNDALRVTAIVFGFVLVTAIFLWGADKVLEFVLYNIILGWKK